MSAGHRLLTGARKRRERLLTAADFSAGVFSGSSVFSYSVLTNIYDGTDGIKLVGKSTLSAAAGWADQYKGTPKWEIRINLSNYKKIIFHAQKVANNGNVTLTVDTLRLLSVAYSQISTQWIEYSVDVTSYRDLHVVGFLGGYPDVSGSDSSQTRFANIRFA